MATRAALNGAAAADAGRRADRRLGPRRHRPRASCGRPSTRRSARRPMRAAALPPAQRRDPRPSLRPAGQGWQVVAEADGLRVRGRRIEEAANRTDFDERGVAGALPRLLERLGIEAELRRRGAEAGTTVRIGAPSSNGARNERDGGPDPDAGARCLPCPRDTARAGAIPRAAGDLIRPDPHRDPGRHVRPTARGPPLAGDPGGRRARPGSRSCSCLPRGRRTSGSRPHDAAARIGCDMTRLAIAGDPLLRAVTIEMERPGPRTPSTAWSSCASIYGPDDATCSW